MELYKTYINNLFILLKIYNFPVYWFKIDEKQFYDYYSSPVWDFSYHKNNPTLQKYKNSPTKLAEEILKIGMYFPFFFFEYKGYKIMLMGKHRLYALLQYNAIKKIDKKFMFIKLPYPWDIKFPLLKHTTAKYFSNNNLIPKDFKITNYKNITDLLLNTGDCLGPRITSSNIKPFEAFNNEEAFKQWINI